MKNMHAEVQALLEKHAPLDCFANMLGEAALRVRQELLSEWDKNQFHLLIMPLSKRQALRRRVRELECVCPMEMWHRLGFVFPWQFTDPDGHAAHVCLSKVSRGKRGTNALCDGFSFPSQSPSPLPLLYNIQTQGAKSQEYKESMDRFSNT